MTGKRILTVQDISCVGRCSITVALPILSACGHETGILPTAVLSTHTGGFSRPAVCHMDDSINAIASHWIREGVRFDLILTGYLGSVGAVEAVLSVCQRLLAPGGVLIVDPAMADHGRLYSGLDEGYVSAMKKLCEKADILLPNITEAAMLAGIPLRQPDPEYISALLERVPGRNVVLTGIGDSPDETGAEILADGRRSCYRHPREARNHHGTGDIFAACFAGAYACGKDIDRSVKIAADFTAMAIANTDTDAEKRFGVRFEPCLWKLKGMLE